MYEIWTKAFLEGTLMCTSSFRVCTHRMLVFWPKLLDVAHWKWWSHRATRTFFDTFTDV